MTRSFGLGCCTLAGLLLTGNKVRPKLQPAMRTLATTPPKRAMMLGRFARRWMLEMWRGTLVVHRVKRLVNSSAQ
jgi:hypothetical protein